MADITGSYDLYGCEGYSNLALEGVEKDGRLQGHLLTGTGEKVEIHGSYGAARGELKFNDASFPGEVLMTTFFSGKRIPSGGETVILHGTWTEQTFTFRDRMVTGLTSIGGEWSAIHGMLIS